MTIAVISIPTNLLPGFASKPSLVGITRGSESGLVVAKIAMILGSGLK